MTLLKDQNAVLPYGVDWSEFIASLPGESIAAAVWVIPAGITVVSEALDGDTHTITVGGGTPGRLYRFTSRVTTTGGYVNEYDLDLLIQRDCDAPDPPPERLVSGNFVYDSSIDLTATYLFAKYAYLTGRPRPIVVIMHGFVDGADSATDAIMQDMAEYGFFAVAVGMRGRDNANGSPDVSARELQDIADAVEYVKARFAPHVDAERVHVAGYSGGGGNALALAAKYPDYFTVVASHFGMSDYGYDDTYGWGDQAGSARQGQLAAWVGYRARSGWSGSAPVSLNAYRARASLEAIAINRQGGRVYLYHDTADGAVNVSHSRRVASAFTTAGNPRASYSETTSGDDPRWLHDMPHPVGDPLLPAGAPVRFTRDEWGADVLGLLTPAWTVPVAGVMRVLGHLVTKRFSVWLGDGTEHVAELVYDTEADTYAITPLTGSMTVTVTAGGYSVTESITGPVTLRTRPLFYDSFTAPDGTLLEAHTPDRDVVGGGWGGAVGVWHIVGGEVLRLTRSGGATDGISVDVGVAEHSVEAIVTPGSQGGGGVSVRVQDQDNHYWVGITSNLNSLAIVERTGGSATVRAQTSHSFTANTPYRVRVVTTSAGVSVECDGVTASYSSASKNAATRVGIANLNASLTDELTRKWDEFTVRLLP